MGCLGGRGGWVVHACKSLSGLVAPSVCSILRPGDELAVQQMLGISLSLLSYDMLTQGIVSLTRTFAGVCSIGTQTLRLAKEAPAFYKPLSCAWFWFSYKIHLPFRISLFLSCSCFSPSSHYSILSCFIPKSFQTNALLSWLILLRFVC